MTCSPVHAPGAQPATDRGSNPQGLRCSSHPARASDPARCQRRRRPIRVAAIAAGGLVVALVSSLLPGGVAAEQAGRVDRELSALPDASVVRGPEGTWEFTASQRLVEYYVGAALAERAVIDEVMAHSDRGWDHTASQRLVQHYVDAALAERRLVDDVLGG